MLEENNVIIGKNIRNARLLKGITMSELIDILKINYNYSITQPTLSKYENGVVKNIPENVLVKIASALDVSLEFLLDNTKSNSDEDNNKIVMKLIINTKDKIVKWNNLSNLKNLDNYIVKNVEKHLSSISEFGTSVFPVIDFKKSFFTIRGEYFFYLIFSKDNNDFNKISFFIFSSGDDELLIELTNIKNYTGELYKLISSLHNLIYEPKKSKEELAKENILDLLDEPCFNKRY